MAYSTGQYSHNFPKPGVSAVVARKNTVLLIQRAEPPYQGLWSLPGGHIHPGETVRSAILRELQEEAGLTVDIVGLADVVDIIEHADDGSLALHYVLSVFYCRPRSGTARPGSDARAVVWQPKNTLDALPMTPGTAEIIRAAQDGSHT